MRDRTELRRRADARSRPLELEDIQGNILRSYKLAWAAHRFLRFDDAEAGRRLLRELLDDVTMEHTRGWPERKPSTTLNVAFTAKGLRAIGVPEDVLERFPKEFRDGMAKRAERFLGDTGPSASSTWPQGLRDAHLLLSIHAASAAARDEALTRLRRRLETAGGGVQVSHQREAQELAGRREHFGFTDGFSQPAVDGGPVPMRRGAGVPDGQGGWRPLKAGEFVLGYEDEDGALPVAPPAPYGLNGTFMVYRELEQDVPLFRDVVGRRARELGWDHDRLAAKIVGRWPDGSPLALTPERPDPVLGNDPEECNAYTYAKDPHGYACPLGAHVRRANPRDALPGGAERSRRHRLIRRGMPYGPPLEGDEPDRRERGLVFICFNASIARQFEVVQRWLLDGSTFGVGEESDYLLGSNDGDGGKMTVHGDPPAYAAPQPPFVITRGGEYLFVPGMRALRALSGADTGTGRPRPATAVVAEPPAAPATALGRHAREIGWRVLVSRPVLALLRWRRPIQPTSIGWVVTRYDDVREVLDRHEDFAVPYLPRMEAMTGPFILGLDDSPPYRWEFKVLHEALYRGGAPGGADGRTPLDVLAADSARLAEEALAGAPRVVDVVSEVVDPVVAETIGRTVGLRFPDAWTLMEWSRAVFREVFINAMRDPHVTRRAEQAARSMDAHLEAQIAGRRRALERDEAPEPTMLDRLILAERSEGGLDDDRLKASLFGIVVAWAVSVSRSTAFALDELLRRPEELAAAQRAARRGDPVPVSRQLLEAMRFRPQAEAVARRCPNGATIAAGTDRARTIPPGAVVVLLTKSAMLDGRAVAKPRRFRADRGDDDYQHFGHGLHRCFGEHVGKVQLGAIGMALLARDVRRHGRLARTGPFPSRLEVVLPDAPARPGRL